MQFSLMKLEHIFRFTPFYEDFRVMVQVKMGETKIMENQEEIDKQLETIHIKRVLKQGVKVISPTYKVNFQAVVFEDDSWGIYMEKVHLWDYFHSVGTVILISDMSEYIVKFLENLKSTQNN